MAQSKGWNLDEWVVPSGRIRGARTNVSDSATPTIDSLLSNRYFLSTAQAGITLQVPTNRPTTSSQAQGFLLTIFCNTTTTTLDADTATSQGFKYSAAVPSLPTLSSGQYIDIWCEYNFTISRWVFEGYNVYS